MNRVDKPKRAVEPGTLMESESDVPIRVTTTTDLEGREPANSQGTLVRLNSIKEISLAKLLSVGGIAAVIVAFITIIYPAAASQIYEAIQSSLHDFFNPTTAHGAVATQILAVLLSAIFAYTVFYLFTLRGRTIKTVERLLRNAKTDIAAAQAMLERRDFERAKESAELVIKALNHIMTKYYKPKYRRAIGEPAWSQIETAKVLMDHTFGSLDDLARAEGARETLEEAHAALSYAERHVAFAYLE